MGDVRDFARLLGFLRPYRTGSILSLVFALAAMVGTVAIPWLTGKAIDAAAAGRQADLSTWMWALVGAAVARWALTVARRQVAGRVSLGVERDLRERFTDHLQSLELAFFERTSTGQLMSRATVDLGSVRFFLGYGLIFLLQSSLTIVLSAIAMLLINPPLALLA